MEEVVGSIPTRSARLQARLICFLVHVWTISATDSQHPVLLGSPVPLAEKGLSSFDSVIGILVTKRCSITWDRTSHRHPRQGDGAHVC